MYTFNRKWVPGHKALRKDRPNKCNCLSVSDVLLPAALLLFFSKDLSNYAGGHSGFSSTFPCLVKQRRIALLRGDASACSKLKGRLQEMVLAPLPVSIPLVPMQLMGARTVVGPVVLTIPYRTAPPWSQNIQFAVVESKARLFGSYCRVVFHAETFRYLINAEEQVRSCQLSFSE